MCFIEGEIDYEDLFRGSSIIGVLGKLFISFVLINWFNFLNSDFSVCSSVYLFVNVYISRFKMVVRLTGSKFHRVVLSRL